MLSQHHLISSLIHSNPAPAFQKAKRKYCFWLTLWSITLTMTFKTVCNRMRLKSRTRYQNIWDVNSALPSDGFVTWAGPQSPCA